MQVWRGYIFAPIVDSTRVSQVSYFKLSFLIKTVSQRVLHGVMGIGNTVPPVEI